MRSLVRLVSVAVLIVAMTLLMASGGRLRTEGGVGFVLGFAGVCVALSWAVIALVAARRRLQSLTRSDAGPRESLGDLEFQVGAVLSGEDPDALTTIVLDQDPRIVRQEQERWRRTRSRREIDLMTEEIVHNVEDVSRAGARPTKRPRVTSANRGPKAWFARLAGKAVRRRGST